MNQPPTNQPYTTTLIGGLMESPASWTAKVPTTQRTQPCHVCNLLIAVRYMILIVLYMGVFILCGTRVPNLGMPVIPYPGTQPGNASHTIPRYQFGCTRVYTLRLHTLVINTS